MDEAPRVLVPGGNKARLASPKALKKPAAAKEGKAMNAEDDHVRRSADGRALGTAVRKSGDALKVLSPPLSTSCSSELSAESVQRIRKSRVVVRSRPDAGNRGKVTVKTNASIVPVTVPSPPPPLVSGEGRRRCAWVTPNADPAYIVFHDEEWGVPVHDDRRLFEMLVLSGALAERTWPEILVKRQAFREVFMDFDPVAVSKLNEKKLTAPGSAANALMSELKLRSVVENAHHILKVAGEFGSFSAYCWSFLNHRPALSRVQYSRQVPVKSPKADLMSKDMLRRGFRSVSPTIVYSFMQACGLTNDHLISCFRFEECAAAATTAAGGAVEPVAEGTKAARSAKMATRKLTLRFAGLSKSVDVLTIA